MSWNPGARGDAFWWIAGVALVLVISLSLSWCYWEELRSDKESLSTTVRNVGLVIGGAIAILFAVWRSIVAEKQAKTAQRGLLNERYQKGAEMLGSLELSVRLGGIYAFARLAREHPGDYHTQIMSLLCAFVRNPTGEPVEAAVPAEGLTPSAKFTVGFESDDEDDCDASGQLREGADVHPPRVREDVQAVMAAFRERSESQIETEEKERYCLNLFGANLKNVSLISANLRSARLDLILAKFMERINLSGAIMSDANLSGAVMPIANLIGANLTDANLNGADLNDAKLHRANLAKADLSGAELKGCKGLTQKQLDQAVVQEGGSPKLEGAVDANTGEPLVWRGRSITE